MTRPVWDGEGDDPWLPFRLDAILDADSAERSVYESVWAALSSWLVTTSRRVLSGVVPDPDAVFSMMPAWERAVADIIVTAIIPIMDRAYAELFGRGFSWRERPNVVNYLAGVRNRLVGIPGEVFDLVGGQVAAGVTLGEGIPEISQRVDDVLSTTKSPRWPNRAVVIARTEALGALNGSRADAFAAFDEETEEEMERMWLSTIDSRTRPTHVVADQQRTGITDPFMVGGFALMFPGDPTGPAQEVIQCVPADTAVDFPSVRAVTRRWFEGEMIRVRVASGDVLTITPNHPILRSDGSWTPAGLLAEGDYCIGGFMIRESSGEPDEDGRPSQIGDLYSAACQSQRANRVALSPPDLHGDAPHGDVEVVTVDGGLGFDGNPASDEQVNQFGLAASRAARAREGGTYCGLMPTGVARGEVDSLDSPFLVGGGCQCSTVCGARASHADAIGLAGGSRGQAEVSHAPTDDVAVQPQGSSDRQNALPVLVSLAKVVQVDRFDFRGHVFNLDTGVGWYIANGITVKNCRCTTLLLEKGETVDLSNRQMKRR